MNNKTLGALALLGAPWMGIGVLAEEYVKQLDNSWFTGLWGIIYITTWMGGMVVLRRLHVSGTNLFGKALPLIILATLTVANISNVWQIVAPTNKSQLFWTLDMFWPLSHLLMIVFGVAVIRANRLPGWYRFVPLLCGFWLPVAMSTKFLLSSTMSLSIGVIYNVVAWCLLALVAFRSGRHGTSIQLNRVIPV
jgi:hypothetical protein